MLGELKQLLQGIHEKLDTLLSKEQPITNQAVQFADGEIEKIVSEVVARLTGEVVAPQDPSDPQSESEAQQIEVQQQ